MDYEEKMRKDYEQVMESYGYDAKAIDAAAEEIIADIYKRKGRKPTYGEVMSGLIEAGYEHYEVISRAASKNTRGML